MHCSLAKLHTVSSSISSNGKCKEITILAIGILGWSECYNTLINQL